MSELPKLPMELTYTEVKEGSKVDAVAGALVLAGAFNWLAVGYTHLSEEKAIPDLLDLLYISHVPGLQTLVYLVVGGCGAYVLLNKFASVGDKIPLNHIVLPLANLVTIVGAINWLVTAIRVCQENNVNGAVDNAVTASAAALNEFFKNVPGVSTVWGMAPSLLTEQHAFVTVNSIRLAVGLAGLYLAQDAVSGVLAVTRKRKAA